MSNNKTKLEIRRCLVLVLVCFGAAEAFVTTTTTTTTCPTTALRTFRPSLLPSSFSLAAKRKKSVNSSGKGFGKQTEEETTEAASAASSSEIAPEKSTAAAAPLRDSAFLQSIPGGSKEKPKLANVPSPEDRAKQLLRDKYGMKTLEEERLSQKRQEQVAEQRKRFAELKAKAEAEEDLDLIAMIPGPVIQGIFKVLQAGIVVTGTVFILSGLGITVEAWSKTSGEPLPENLDAFIANIIEPNFTTMLLVLLGFSISLGALAAAQMGSKAAQYSED